MKKKTPLEKETQLTICKYLALKKYFFWRQNTSPIFDKTTGFYRPMPKYSMTGVPDIIIIKDGGKVCFLEVKRAGIGKLSEAQETFKETCEELGAEYHIVTSLDEVLKIGL